MACVADSFGLISTEKMACVAVSFGLISAERMACAAGSFGLINGILRPGAAGQCHRGTNPWVVLKRSQHLPGLPGESYCDSFTVTSMRGWSLPFKHSLLLLHCGRKVDFRGGRSFFWPLGHWHEEV